MQAASPVRQRPNLTNVLFMLLLVGLAAGRRADGHGAQARRLRAGVRGDRRERERVPAGEGAPACFQVLVQNTGVEAANVRCELVPAEGTTAVFFSGRHACTRAPRSIAPQQTIPLSVKVDVTEGNDTVVSPSVGCSPAPA